ncbi:CHC2 zinc finger domain-containing protein [Nocardia grenadensis]|uniref:CHC2 zinc finger domain-containing protein n=1 Tax=Nocardia grenadensis TaxID=931537 RepID=UPI003D71961D
MLTLSRWVRPLSTIVDVIRKYYPAFDPPADQGREWIKILCPFHAESNPSATISFERNAFICRSCGVKGDVYSIIMHEEEVSFAEAKRIAEKVSPGSNPVVRQPAARKPGRRVFGKPSTAGTESREGSVLVRVRRRPAPWS